MKGTREEKPIPFIKNLLGASNLFGFFPPLGSPDVKRISQSKGVKAID